MLVAGLLYWVFSKSGGFSLELSQADSSAIEPIFSEPGAVLRYGLGPKLLPLRLVCRLGNLVSGGAAVFETYERILTGELPIKESKNATFSCARVPTQWQKLVRKSGALMTLSKKACPVCRLLSSPRMISWVIGTKVVRSCASASLK